MDRRPEQTTTKGPLRDSPARSQSAAADRRWDSLQRQRAIPTVCCDWLTKTDRTGDRLPR